MSKDKKHIILFVLGIAGLLFSGYLSSVKLFSNTCALNESCPYFLGFPACYYGFGMFLIIAVSSFFLLLPHTKRKLALAVLSTVSFLGILFAGNFTLQEMPLLLEKGFTAYVLGLPTCAMGLFFYLLIFFISTYSLFKKTSNPQTTKQF